MGDIRRVKGKLWKRLPKDDETLEDFCERLVRDDGYTELPAYCDSWTEALYEYCCDDYIISDAGNVYEFSIESDAMVKELPCAMVENEDGSYNFDFVYDTEYEIFPEVLSRMEGKVE